MVSRLLLIFLLLLPAGLRADAPRVVADIAPVHSLVARVMAGVAEPTLILEPGTSPHGYAMRPSDAAALQEADLVVWIGPELTPSLDRAMKSLADGARELSLLHADGTHRLPVREEAVFGDAHKGHENADDDHAHSHDHGHDHGSQAHGDHAHDGAHDSHVWLDPENARVWLDLIAATLADIDPEHATIYRDNAAAARADLAVLIDEIAAKLQPASDKPFLVYHDAYLYFETRFGLNVLGSVAISDSVAPGAARMAALRDLVAKKEPRCAFFEPQFSPKLVETLTQGTGLRAAELDPIGQALTPGPELYPALLRNMAEAITSC